MPVTSQTPPSSRSLPSPTAVARTPPTPQPPSQAAAESDRAPLFSRPLLTSLHLADGVRTFSQVEPRDASLAQQAEWSGQWIDRRKRENKERGRSTVWIFLKIFDFKCQSFAFTCSFKIVSDVDFLRINIWFGLALNFAGKSAMKSVTAYPSFNRPVWIHEA